MIQTGFDTRIKVQQIINNQLPEFIIDENPNASEFLKQYYISQEFQGGTVDIAENLDQYLKIDNLAPEVINNFTTLQGDITSSTTQITVNSIKGFPPQYGLLQIDSEIITYTGISSNTFIGCVRGFSGITSYHSPNNPEELVFSTSNAGIHTTGANVVNLSALFLKEFYKKLKYSVTPGLENVDFIPQLNVSSFIKSAKSFYQSKGTKESFRILFNILYGVNPTILNLGDFLVRPSAAKFIRRKEIVAERISGNPNNIVGQTITKSNDPTTTGSVSQVEIFTVNNKQYYKISLFVGYEDSSAITGTFTIPGKTKVVDTVSVGSSVITVDSTIGFPKSGTVICNQNSITYSDKSVNQFFGCVGIVSTILPTSDVRSDETIFAYENGDLTKRVDLRITGVLSGFQQFTNNVSVNVGEEIYVKNLGQIITDPPDSQKTFKHLIANSWIYNTSSRYQISNISGSTFSLYSIIDKSSLKIGDTVEILYRDTEIVASSTTNLPYIQSINVSNNQVVIANNGSFVYNPNLQYDLRRKLSKANSSGAFIEFGNNLLTSDVTNVYANDQENSIYVASGGLPSYTITKNLFQSTIPEGTGSQSQSAQGIGYLQGFDGIDSTFSIISFASPVSFLRGDLVYYLPEKQPLPGLTQGLYYVDVISSNQIRLYQSNSLIPSGSNYVRFGSLGAGTGSHTFILGSQRYRYISSQKILKKFNSFPNIQSGKSQVTQPGTTTGLLINGVEIQNYKSPDRVFYGPLTSIKILNQGNNYDVINPPVLSINGSSTTKAQIQPVVQGSITKILVDPQNFDLNTVVSVAVTGGNGSGAVLSPIVIQRRREVSFDARVLSGLTGGVDVVNDTISFLSPHNFKTGDSVIYSANGNLPIGVSTNYSNNLPQGLYLTDSATYYVSVVNNVTVQLFNSRQNATAGINTIPFSNQNNVGIHKLKSGIVQNTISEVKVISGGSGYTNRKLIVKSSGISTFNNAVSFPNHNFNEKDLIVYNYQISPVSGLSTSTYYFVSKIDNNSFRLCDAGIGGTNTSNYTRGNYVTFTGIGSGYHYFSYPPITVTINAVPVGIGSTLASFALNATPSVRGKIIDAYLYEQGTGYGSNILNLQNKPIISTLKGSDARLTPFVTNSGITSVVVSYGGTNFYSEPDIVVNGTGTGCIIRPVIGNGRIVNAIVISPGIGYSSNNTTITVKPSGSGAVFDSNIRSLTVNANFKYGDEIVSQSYYNRNLAYTVSGYFNTLQNAFNDTDKNHHSPIIGWAYDGNPIYGPFGYSDPTNTGSLVKILNPGYQLSIESLYNRPPGFSAGFFVEDYIYTGNGDLDQNNGRYTKTPEFPKGVYAYFAGVTTSKSSTTTQLVSQFPYFIGNSYRSTFIQDNLSINQDYDFNNSNLVRNVFPYKLSENYAGNDFIIDSSKLQEQKCTVQSVSRGSITSAKVVSGGQNYKVNDLIQFDNSASGGGGFSAIVSKIGGVGISSITNVAQKYTNAILNWENPGQIRVNILPSHSLLNGDSVVISGLTTNLANINGYYNIGFSSYTVSLAQSATSYPTGIVTDIFVSSIPPRVTIGSSISIGSSEIATVLNVFNSQNALRIYRSNPGIAWSTGTFIGFVPDSFIINKSVGYFPSRINDSIYFNPLEAIGYGVTSTSVGIPSYTTYSFAGITTNVRYIPLKSIYIPNHPFTDNQLVTITIPDPTYSPISVSTSFGGSTFSIPPIGGISTSVYISNKTKDTVGIRTQLNSPDLFFIPNLANNLNSYFYNISSNYPQSSATAQKNQTTVYTSINHNLNNNDLVNLTVQPNLSVGIGTSSAIKLIYNSSNQNILVNPLTFTSSGINTYTDTITINSHNFNTGDKVYYVGISTIAVASGLSTGNYYVYKIDNNNFQLCQTYKDSTSVPPNIIDIQSQGGTQQLSLINPQIIVYKNNDLVFDMTDPSLTGYNIKFYYDNAFKNEFVSIGNTSIFAAIGLGTAGISTNASVTLNYSAGMPDKLYYTLKKSAFISTSDTDVANASRILFIDSIYNGSYNVSGVGSATFNICLPTIPETSSYTSSQCNNLSYTTNSLTASGPISNIRVLSPGTNYKKLPVFSNIVSAAGTGGYISATSTQVGNVNQSVIYNQGFEYASDKTLSPTAFISPSVILQSSNTIQSINVVDGGKYYTRVPDLVLVDSTSGNKINSGIINANLSSSSVETVSVIAPPVGIPDIPPRVVSINNSNGNTIDTVITSGTGIVTCYLTTPVVGFNTAIFNVGDLVFVENIQLYNNYGTGYNSADNGYQFFPVISVLNTNPVQITFSIPGIGTNPGIANTSQLAIPSIVNYKNVVKCSIVQNPGKFIQNEPLLVQSINQSNFTKQNIRISSYDKNLIKVTGTYQLAPGDIIIGSASGTRGTVNSIQANTGKFNIDYATEKDYGWEDNTGKVSEDDQFIADNDYYQDMAYTVKSPIQYQDLSTPVNSLLHTSGTKNFADVGITSGSSALTVGFTTAYTIIDILDQQRVDTINNYDLTLDYQVINGKSNFLKLINRKLVSYIQCNTNRVLRIDDISSQFSSIGLPVSDQNNIVTVLPTETFDRFLVQIIDTNNSQYQLTELVSLNNTYVPITGSFVNLEKGTLSNGPKVGDLTVITDSFNNNYLNFKPVDPFNTDYNIKVLKSTFSIYAAGIGSTSVGFANVFANNQTGIKAGVTTSLVSVFTTSPATLYANVQVIDEITNEMNYAEIYVVYDGNDTYISDYYFTSNVTRWNLSFNEIGSFSSSYSSGILSLNYKNTNNTNTNTVRSKVINFGPTSSGIGTYRFIISGQIPGLERSARYQTDYTNVSTASSIFSLNAYDISGAKSLIQVSIGSTYVLHQVMMINDITNQNTYTLEYPYLTNSSSSGIGTFGGEYNTSTNQVGLKFYPDPQFIGSSINIQSYTEVLYAVADVNNTPPSLTYGPIVENVSLAQVSGVNGQRINRLNFNANYNNTPIYQKTFNPSDNTVLNPTTGLFSIPNHFFSTGEQLSYVPSSTFLGVGATGIGIGATANNSGIVTSILPPTVYAIKVTNDTFKLSTRKDYALAGIYVTFTSYGSGNAHNLIMSKRLEKTILSLDGVVQYPISFTPINFNLNNNGGQISVGTTYFALAGISSIKPDDILKVDNEYMKVVNVGFGSTASGPILNSYSVPIVNVIRGFVGSSATSHLDGTNARVYRGSYNIEGQQIWFTSPPLGNLLTKVDSSNLIPTKSSFAGRVYLRSDYSTNQIYDNISDNFTGIGQTYTLTVQGINTTGIGTIGGSGILFLNDVFQTPSTFNNSLNNYAIQDNSNVGITSAVFTGITSDNGQLIKSSYDINSNQLPRGGVIVSLGTTDGIGYAPLVGAAVTVTVDNVGRILSIGIGTTGTYGSGYNFSGSIGIGISDDYHSLQPGANPAFITANVGAGGTLIFNILASGDRYTPQARLSIPSPTYSNLPVNIISRLSTGTTSIPGQGLLLNVSVSAATTAVGIASTYFAVDSFKIIRPGYAFQKGDVLQPVGLVTDPRLSSPISNFQLTVIDTFSDSFAAWQFGDLDYIDSIVNLQDGVRTRFPLYYNSQLLSFEINALNSDSSLLDLNSVLIIFINGVIQDPATAYQFYGGSSFTFTDPPQPQDKVAIFFYRGTRNVDSVQVTVNESIKVGDAVQVLKNDSVAAITTSQNSRLVIDLPASDKMQTNIYTDVGIDPNVPKPFNWTKQKVDNLISGQVFYKIRDSIETEVYPTAKIIRDFSSSDTVLYVDDANFFNYEYNSTAIPISSFDGLIVSGNSDPVGGALTAFVDPVTGQITSFSLNNVGSGYTGSSVTLKISKPPVIGPGIGTTAVATISVVNGSLSNPITIVNPGLGYNPSNPPAVFVPPPKSTLDPITAVTNVQGFSGIITGIGTTSGTSGNPLAIKFYLNTSALTPFPSGLATGFPIYITGTPVGNGITSIDSNNSAIVGIGTTYLDNVYYIHQFSYTGTTNVNAQIICNVNSNTSVVGIATTGNYLGKFSWGVIRGFNRSSSPVSIAVSGYTVNSGLSSFPTVQRRGYGLRNTGALKKTF